MAKWRTGPLLAFTALPIWYVLGAISGNQDNYKTVGQQPGGIEVQLVELKDKEVRENTVSLRYVITVKNVGTSEVVIDRILAGCTCTSVEPEHLVLAPAASGTVQATIATNRGEDDVYEHSFIELRGYQIGMTRPVFVARLAKGSRVPMDVYPTTLIYADKAVKDKAISSRPLFVRPEVADYELYVTPSQNTQCLIGREGRGWIVRPVFTPPVDGAVPEDIELVLFDKKMDRPVGTKRIRYDIYAATGLRLIPRSHDWGIVEIGLRKEVEVNIVDTNGHGVEIAATKCIGHDDIRITSQQNVGVYKISMLVSKGYQSGQIIFDIRSGTSFSQLTLKVEAFGR